MKTCKGIVFHASAVLTFGKDSKLLIGLADRMDHGVGLGVCLYKRVNSHSLACIQILYSLPGAR